MTFLLLVFVMAAGAQDSEEGRRILCGRELARARLLYCYGLEPEPKEVDATTKLPAFDTNVVGGAKVPSRFTHKLRRAALRDEFATGLVESCCVQPCHISELLKKC